MFSYQLLTCYSYLGDALIHASFPLLLYSHGLLSPWVLLGPLTNWFFLRYVSGDKENERSQEERYRDDPEKKVDLEVYKMEKNAFWPSITEVGNTWTWVVVGLGFVGVGLERVVQLALQ